MLHTIVLWLALTARAHAAIPDIQHERRFRLDYNSHASHLFVTGRVPLNPTNPEVKAAIAALDTSCEVILRGPTIFEKEPAAAEAVILADRLSPSARRTLHELGLDALLDRDAPVAIDTAWRAVRAALVAWRLRLEERHYLERESEDSITIDFNINPELHRVAYELFGRAFDAGELLMMAGEWSERLIEGLEAPRVELIDHLAARAKHQTIRTTSLDRHSPDPNEDVDLDALLAALRPVLHGQGPTEVFVNEMVAAFIEAQVSDQFFTLPPDKLARIRAALVASGLFHYSVWPGEAAVANYEANVHEHWVDPIVEALARGQTFIAVDAAHVLPGFGPERRRSLLELLHQAGVTITPVSTRPPRLRLIE